MMKKYVLFRATGFATFCLLFALWPGYTGVALILIAFGPPALAPFFE